MSNWFTRGLQALEKVPGEISHLFTTHQTQIHDAISEAQTALGTAAAVASVTGESEAAAKIGQISHVLTNVSTTAANLGNVQSLNDAATAIGGAVKDFVDSGIAVKNQHAQAAVDNAVGKAQAVVGKINEAVAGTPAS